jgi:hypothetical protein
MTWTLMGIPGRCAELCFRNVKENRQTGAGEFLVRSEGDHEAMLFQSFHTTHLGQVTSARFSI